MFTPPHDPLLDTLDELLGAREATRELLALATAAVLTASPHGSENHWLRELKERIPKAAAPPEVVLNNHRGPAFPRSCEPHSKRDERRTQALDYLLQTLDEDHQGHADCILERLGSLAASALTAAQPGLINQWSELVRTTHRSVQHDYLERKPELN